MKNRKTLLVIFGDVDVLKKFNDIHLEVSGGDEPLSLRLKKLNTQISFIMGEDEFNNKKTMSLKIKEYNPDTFDYIIKETEGIDNLRIKFIVLDNGKEENRENIIRLISKIEEISGGDMTYTTPNDVDETMKSMMLYDDVNILNHIIHSMDHLVGIVKNSYKVDSISNARVPEEISGGLKETFTNLIIKLNDNIKDG